MALSTIGMPLSLGSDVSLSIVAGNCPMAQGAQDLGSGLLVKERFLLSELPLIQSINSPRPLE